LAEYGLGGRRGASYADDGRRKSPRRVDDKPDALGDDARVMSGASPELELERSVRNRLYGERLEVTATPSAGPRREPEPLGRLVGGRYRLLERVGVGGMASVYRAWDERLKRHVAVKLIAEWLARDPVSVRRFRREAELSARLGHPNIVCSRDRARHCGWRHADRR
jgi:hypothetical protein